MTHYATVGIGVAAIALAGASTAFDGVTQVITALAGLAVAATGLVKVWKGRAKK